MSFDFDVICVENYCNDFSGFAWRQVTVTATDSPYTTTDGYAIVEADVTDGPITIQLSTVPRWDNQVIWFRRVDPTHTGNTVTIIPQPGYTVMGGVSIMLTTQNQIIALERDPSAPTDWRTLVNGLDQIAPTHARGDMIVHSGTTNARLPVGADGTVLIADSAQSVGVRWGVQSGGGDVIGPGASTDNAIARFNGTSGKVIQNSGITIDDANNISGAANYTSSGLVNGRNVATDGSTLDSHVSDFSNPHNVTAAQVGNTTAQWNASSIQSAPVSATTPTTGQLLVYNGTAWAPTSTISILNSIEDIAVAGGGAASPTLNTKYTFVTVTGSGTATGTLANGSPSLNGFEKVVVASDLAAGTTYTLTVTSMITGNGQTGTRIVTFTNTGPSIYLVWKQSRSAWFIVNTGAPLA